MSEEPGKDKQKFKHHIHQDALNANGSLLDKAAELGFSEKEINRLRDIYGASSQREIK